MSKQVTLFYATDIHGSEACFKKIVTLLAHTGRLKKKPDSIILGSDFIGLSIPPYPEVLVHVVQHSNGAFETRYRDTPVRLKDRRELASFREAVEAVGGYINVCDQDFLRHSSEHPSELRQLLINLQLQRLKSWVDFADRELKSCGRRIYVTPGNNDPLGVEDILRQSSVFVNANEQVLDIEGGMTLLSVGSSIESWRRAARELPDETIGEKLNDLLRLVRDMRKCIISTHCPPYGTLIDMEPDFDPSSGKARLDISGAIALRHIGSQNVRQFILNHHPLVGFHGLAHDTYAQITLGETQCYSPGTQYLTPKLRGAYVVLKDGRVDISSTLTDEDPAGDMSRISTFEHFGIALLEKMPGVGPAVKAAHTHYTNAARSQEKEQLERKIADLEGKMQVIQDDLQLLLKRVADIQSNIPVPKTEAGATK